MNVISNVSYEACIDSKYINLKRMRYMQKSKEKSWDIASVHDSVCVLLYHERKDAFILVRQFRPPVYVKNDDGFTYELCAGIVDKDKSLEQITVEEIEEECGYRIDTSRLKRVNSFYSAVGFAGSKQTLYFASLNDSDMIHEGGGIDEENIEVIYIPVDEAKSFLFDETKIKTPSLMYAFMWYLERSGV